MANPAETGLQTVVTENLRMLCGSDAEALDALAPKPRNSKKKKQKLVSDTPIQASQQDKELLKRKVKEQREKSLDSIKAVCKSYPEQGPELVSRILIRQYLAEAKTAEDLVRAMQVADELFKRSANFRMQVCPNLRYVLDSIFKSKLDGRSSTLTETCADILRGWAKMYGDHYPQLKFGLASMNVPLEKPDPDVATRRETERMRLNALKYQRECVERGFKIQSGVELTGHGQSEAEVIQSTYDCAEVIENAMPMLVRGLGSLFNPEDFMQEESKPSEVSSVQNNSGSIHPATQQQEQINMEEVEWDGEDVEWESDDDDDGVSYIPATDAFEQRTVLPNQVVLKLDGVTNDEQTADIRSAVLDARLTLERILLPQMLIWATALEQLVAIEPSREAAECLVEVKRLIHLANEAVAKCNRMNIKSKPKVRSKDQRSKRKRSSRSSRSVGSKGS